MYDCQSLLFAQGTAIKISLLKYRPNCNRIVITIIDPIESFDAYLVEKLKYTRLFILLYKDKLRSVTISVRASSLYMY
jgi:hypothetical protein